MIIRLITYFALAVGSLAFLFPVEATRAATAIISPEPILHFSDNNGFPCVGCKLFTYIAGTTTKVTTYTAADAGTPNTNPIILNARGEANVWLNPTVSYKFILAPPTDSDPPTNPFWTVDNLNAPIGSGALVSGSSTIPSNVVTISVAASAPNTQTLPASPVLWETHIINDAGCNAATNQITISGNGNNIDNLGSSYIEAFNCQSVIVQWNGVIWKTEAINSSNVQHVRNIAALQAIGPASSQYISIEVDGYYSAADGGGGIFVWKTGSPPTGTCNAVTGGGDGGQYICVFNGPTSASGYITTGYRQRQTSGQFMSATWFGLTPLSATGAQLVTGLNSALAACSFKTLFLPPGQIVFGTNSGFIQPANCPVSGDPIAGTELLFPNATAGTTAWTIHPNSTFVGGGLSNISIVGNGTGNPTMSSITLGLLISNMGYFRLDNVTVEAVNGPCVSIGFGVQNIFNNLAASLCAPGAAQANVMLDGATDGQGEGTTTIFNNISAGSDGGFGSGYALMLDNYVTTQFISGALQSTAKIACIGCGTDAAIAATDVFNGVDFENPVATGTSILTIGTGGGSVKSIVLENNSFSGTATNGVFAQNTLGLKGDGNSFTLSGSGIVFYNLDGTGNTGTEIDRTDPSVSTTGYKIATINGVLGNVTFSIPWNLDRDFPITVSGLPSCNTTFVGEHRSITDSNQNFSAGNLGSTVAGGGTNKVGVRCVPAGNWVIDSAY